MDGKCGSSSELMNMNPLNRRAHVAFTWMAFVNFEEGIVRIRAKMRTFLARSSDMRRSTAKDENIYRFY